MRKNFSIGIKAGILTKLHISMELKRKALAFALRRLLADDFKKKGHGPFIFLLTSWGRW